MFLWDKPNLSKLVLSEFLFQPSSLTYSLEGGQMLSYPLSCSEMFLGMTTLPPSYFHKMALEWSQL